MASLLEKTRELTLWLQEAPGQRVEFMDMAQVLGDLIHANIYITGRTGRILGYALPEDDDCPVLKQLFIENAFIPEKYNGMLLKEDHTLMNKRSAQDGCILGITTEECMRRGNALSIVPIVIRGQRQGTLVLTKRSGLIFGEDDTVLAEYGAMVIGMEILRARMEEAEEEIRQQTAVQAAISTLSYTEQEALGHVFSELSGKETLLVASKIADRAGLTRSVIVNAMRKLESAGVIATKSLGMKGTHIKVLNDHIVGEIMKRRGRAV